MLRVIVAGATGWTGREVARAILDAPDLELVGAVATKSAGHDLGQSLGVDALGVMVSSSIDQALRVPCDVLVDYTSHVAVRANVDAAVAHGVGCVVGSSGLTEADFAEIDVAARTRGVGV